MLALVGNCFHFRSLYSPLGCVVGSPSRDGMIGSLTFRQYPTDLVRIICEKCGRAGQYRKATLIERLGLRSLCQNYGMRSPSASGAESSAMRAECITLRWTNQPSVRRYSC